jgi:stress response protein YsnF
MSYTSDNISKTVYPFLDMMMSMQHLGLQALSIYEPLTAALLDPTGAAQRGTRSGFFGGTSGRSWERRNVRNTNEEQVIGVGEEVLNVGTRMVPGKTTRVRRVVVQNPVHQDVTLHTETVVLERRKPIAKSGDDVLTEVTVEMSDFNEVPVVSKSVHLVEEVLLRKELTSRIETIHDTVRRDTLEIEQPSNLPVVFQAEPKQAEKKRDEGQVKRDENQAPQTGNQAPQIGNKAADQKRS